MGLIDDFIVRYRKEYDFYDQTARLVAQILEGNLQGGGIRSIVTARAKSVGRLETKIRQRHATKNYLTNEDILRDIVDLAGVRVALYFPAERVQVDKTIKDLFFLEDAPIEFPNTSNASYAKRFSGYWATHYRVRLKENSLNNAQNRYSEGRVEIQVASVLMHAWAEVEHDLVYKPLQGRLSEEEYSILDELNGLVMAGEIALERLQKAGESRVAASGRQFSNHYDLAAHLLNAARSILNGPVTVAETALGRIDLLFDLLNRLNLATPDLLRPYVTALHADIEHRPLAEQIIDQLLAEDDSRYGVYEKVRADRPIAGDYGVRSVQGRLEPDVHEAIGLFLSRWITFERTLRNQIQSPWQKQNTLPFLRVLESQSNIDESLRAEIDHIRRIRNNVVHGMDIPSPGELRELASRIERIEKTLRK